MRKNREEVTSELILHISEAAEPLIQYCMNAGLSESEGREAISEALLSCALAAKYRHTSGGLMETAKMLSRATPVISMMIRKFLAVINVKPFTVE